VAGGEADVAAGGEAATTAAGTPSAKASTASAAATASNFLSRRVASLQLLGGAAVSVASAPSGKAGAVNSAQSDEDEDCEADYDSDSDTTDVSGDSLDNDGFHLTTTLEPTALPPSWRPKDRMKTVGIGIVLALNIGTPPPDVIKLNVSAVLEAWMDPKSVSRSKGMI
jgi:hypothetical protein